MDGMLGHLATYQACSRNQNAALYDVFADAYPDSPLLLAGTLVGMVLTYLAAPLLVVLSPLHGNPGAAGFGLAAGRRRK